MIMLKQITRLARKSLINTTKCRDILLKSKFWAKTSREIELEMAQEKYKSLVDAFKSLDTTFGMVKPTKVAQQYTKPPTYQFSISSLRKCSHMYPEYLLAQLRKNDSQFYDVLNDMFFALPRASNSEAIEFIQFMVRWQIFDKIPDYAQMMTRKIYQMKLSLSQIFKILKFVVIVKGNYKSQILTDLENKILFKLKTIQISEYQPLFLIINFMRVSDIYPQIHDSKAKQFLQDEQTTQKEETFFQIVTSVLLRNLKDIPISNLVEMIVHYANNVKENQDRSSDILFKVQPRIIENIQFLNHQQLIAVAHSFLKTETANAEFIDAFVRRVDLLYYQIGWANKKRILNIASNLPLAKWQYIAAISQHELLKGKKLINKNKNIQTSPTATEVEYQLAPAIYHTAFETNLMTVELIDKLQSKIIENIFNYSSEDVSLIAWLFTVTPQRLTPKRQNKQLLYSKLQAIIEGGFIGNSFTLKEVSMLVWALCNFGGKTSRIYRPDAPFWTNIQYYIQERISSKKEEKEINSLCQVLWAYMNNRALTAKTVHLITQIIIGKEEANKLEEEMFTYELTTITAFYYSLSSSFPKPISDRIKQICLKYFQAAIDNMNSIELLKMLRYLIYEQPLSEQTWQKIVEQFSLETEQIEYQFIMGIVGILLSCPLAKIKHAKCTQVVLKLMERKRKLQQVQNTQS